MKKSIALGILFCCPSVCFSKDLQGHFKSGWRIWVVWFTLILTSACTSVQEAPMSVNVEAELPADIQSAIIRALPIEPGLIKNIDSNMDEAPEFFARELRIGLSSRYPNWSISVEGAENASSNPDVTITTKILEIDGGSAAKRFWIGFGAGAIKSKVEVSITDSEDKPLATSVIAASTTCPMGVCEDKGMEDIWQNLLNLVDETMKFIQDPGEYEKYSDPD